jgi:hypothetical protein
VRQREFSKGARETAWPAAGLGVIAFDGKAFGRRLVFTYFCQKGVLFAGNYYFPAESLAAAAASYESVHRKLKRTYGAPWLDDSPWSISDLSGPRYEADPQRFMTTWKTNRFRVTTSILPPQENEPKGWRVAIVFSQAADEERSNW